MPLSLGMLGMHGTVPANYAVHECRPAHRRRRALRRPRDRQALGVRAAGQDDHPHRRRPGRDRQERRARASPSWATPATCWSRCSTSCASRGRDARAAPPPGWRASPPGKDEFPLRYEPPSRRHARAAVRDRRRSSASRGGEAVIVHRRRPAPDVVDALLRLPLSAAVDQLRRPGHHGLRPAGGHGRQARPARQDGHRRQRRRRLPDDHAGARHGGELRHPGGGRAS